MPEGHVTHRLATQLTDAFAGFPVRVSSPQGRFADEAALLDGHVLEGADAYGKNLFVDFGQNRVIHIHLGLIGKLWVYAGESPSAAPLSNLRLRIARGDDVAELRGPQTCTLISDEARVDVITRLGPDPLRPDADGARGWAKVSRSSRTIGSLLMDQSVAAGVGNIFRAEVLFRHRINPRREGKALSRRTWNLVWTDLVELMHYAVEEGRIDTVRPEHLPEVMGRPPRVDRHGGEVYVYRRAGERCHVCGTVVRTENLDGRNLYWCPRCQRR